MNIFNKNKKDEKQLLASEIKELQASLIRKDEFVSRLQAEQAKLLTEKELLQTSINALKESNADLQKSIAAEKQNNVAIIKKRNMLITGLIEQFQQVKLLSTSVTLDKKESLNAIMFKLEDILESNDIQVLNSVNVKFNPKIHKILAINETKDSSLHEIVSASLSEGFMYSGDCILPQEVELYIAKK